MLNLKQAIVSRILDGPRGQVWTPVDFLDLGSRAAVDKVLQRLAAAGELRRIDRGFYDTPRLNSLTKQPAVADYRQIIDALGRRDQLRMIVDGMTAANDLGFTTAVPARVVIHTDARRRTIHLDNLTIAFKQTAPSKLYWAGRPAMRIVQALHWLKDTLATDRDRIVARLSDARPPWIVADGSGLPPGRRPAGSRSRKSGRDEHRVPAGHRGEGR